MECPIQICNIKLNLKEFEIIYLDKNEYNGMG